MIKHIVMWRFPQKDLQDSEKETKLQKIKEELESLSGSIPEVVKIEVGFNFGKSDAAYDIALYSEFESEEDLATYRDHPEHQRVASYIKSLGVERAVVDYHQ